MIAIRDKDVIDQYFSESGGRDQGLVMLDSLKEWRKDGWRIGARKIACIRYGGTSYDIWAFAEVNSKDHDEVKQSIYFLSGCYAGILVPQSALDQFESGKAWENIGDNNIRGGHCIYVQMYDESKGLLGCVTWGKIQMMSWNFWDRYCDEAYAIVDNKDHFIEDSPVDVEKLDSILDEITG